MTRTFTTMPAKREQMPLFLGIVAPSGAGKTHSAFRIATGIQSVIGGEIMFINTEGRRGLLDVDMFKKADGSPAITHMPFSAPYASLDYLAAIEQATKGGAKTLIIDSMSHEHEAAGGMLDFQDAELRRMAGDDYGTWKAEKYNMLAWQKPKAARRKLMQGIMQTNINIIACFRAKKTAKPVRVTANGKTKTVVQDMGFTPIAGDEFVYEMTMCALLLPGAKGVPTWHPENPGERMAVKRPGQFESIVPDGAQLSENIGQRLAEWAKGGPREVVREPDDGYAKIAAFKGAIMGKFNKATLRGEVQTVLDKPAHKSALDEIRQTEPDVYAEIMAAAEETMRALPETEEQRLMGAG